MTLGEQLKEARKRKRMTASEVAMATRMKVQIVEDLERDDFSRIAAPVYGKGFIKLYAEAVGIDPKPLLEEYVARAPKVGAAKREAPGVLRREGAARPGHPAPAAPEAPEPEAPRVPGADMDLFAQAQTREPARREPGERSLFAPAPAVNRRKARLFDFGGFFRRAGDDLRRLLRAGRRGGAGAEEEQTEQEAAIERSLPVPYIRLVFLSIALLFVVALIITAVGRCFRSASPSPVPPPGSVQPAEDIRIVAEPPAPYVE